MKIYENIRKTFSIKAHFDKNNELLYLGNVLRLLDQLPNEKIFDLVVTSPPYNIGKEYEEAKNINEYFANQKAIIGARTNSLDRQKELIAQRSIAVQKDMSKISDADLAALVTELQGQITGLQASQQAFVKISNLSLFQFLN